MRRLLAWPARWLVKGLAMLRIAMLAFNVAGKGTYWRALALGQELVARGHRVTLLAISPGRRWRFDIRRIRGVTVVETPDLLPGSLRSGWDPWDVLARIGWLRRRTFDLVHAFENRPVALLPAVYLQRKQGLPLVSDWCDWFGRGGSVEERPNPLVRAVLRPVETFFEEVPRPRADGVTVINTILRQKALDLGVPPERILLLPNGANVREIRPGNQAEARRRLGLPLDVRLIAYTGAIFWRDARLMATAFDQIHSARPDTRLLLVGYCNVAIEELVQRPEAVIRAGPVSYRTLANYLATCDLGWLPLRNSGANRGRFPLKLNDFMAAGRAVVATDVGDLGDLMRQEPIGWLAPDEPGALAEAVLALLADDVERERQGRHARQVAETKLSWPLMATRLERFYLQLKEGKLGSASRHEPILSTGQNKTTEG
jgi:glycosyltransferase involved in cell wall biosynthesis